jgi:tetratricopeptide (TPR) repeat protein
VAYGGSLTLRKLIVCCLLTIIASSRAIQAQHDDHHDGKAHHIVLGHVVFPNSGKATAQKPFLTGLALLHSFEYEAAADSFRAAQKVDPGFALPYWMEALTNSKLVWGLEDRNAALAALSRLGPTSEARIAKARTASERAFGSAVEAFYKEGDEQSRVRAFADSMRKWARAMPNEPEAHAFAALGLIWQAYFLDGKAADSLNSKAVRHAQWVFDRNPQHPGAAHCIIHASDSPAGAARGLKAAREYSRIAPDASHALHMPSHIFLPLGMWEEMIPSNVKAWRATRAEVARQNSPLWENDWHSLTWLQYAYLQLGRWKDARALIDTAAALTAGAKSLKNPADDPDAVYAVEDLAFRYGAETGDWSAFPRDTVPISVSDTTISERAQGFALSSLYQRAIVSVLRGETSRAQSAIAALRSQRPPLADRVELTLLIRRGDTNGVLAMLTRLRPNLRPDRYTSMVPSFALNATEQFARFLVAAGKPRDAISLYQESLADRPRRAASLLGLARAQMAAGQRSSAEKTYDELSKMWRNADPAVRTNLRH